MNPDSALTTIIALSGGTVAAPLDLSPTLICLDGPSTVTSLTTEVLDPSNQPVAHTASKATFEQGKYRTVLSFTPNQSGQYYLTAKFEPSIGVQHRDVLVVADHTADTPFVNDASLPQGCRPTFVSENLVLCDVAGELVAVRPSTHEYQSFDAGTFAFSRPSLWQFGGGVVVRYEDVGGGALVARNIGASGLQAQQPTLAAAPGATQLTFFAGAFAERLSAQPDGGITRELYQNDGGVLVSADALALRLADGGYGVADGAPVGLGQTTRVCTVTVGEAVDFTCAQVPGARTSKQGDGFWVANDERVSSVAFGNANGVPSAASMPAVLTGPTIDFWGGAVPLFGTDQWLMTLRPGSLLVDAFARPPDATAFGVVDNTLWVISSSHQLRAYRLPPSF